MTGKSLKDYRNRMIIKNEPFELSQLSNYKCLPTHAASIQLTPQSDQLRQLIHRIVSSLSRMSRTNFPEEECQSRLSYKTLSLNRNDESPNMAGAAKNSQMTPSQMLNYNKIIDLQKARGDEIQGAIVGGINSLAKSVDFAKLQKKSMQKNQISPIGKNNFDDYLRSEHLLPKQNFNMRQNLQLKFTQKQSMKSSCFNSIMSGALEGYRKLACNQVPQVPQDHLSQWSSSWIYVVI